MFVRIGRIFGFGFFLVTVLTACGLQVPEDPDPGPHQTLLAIARMTRDNDFSKLDDFIYSVEVGTNMTSGEFLRKGIINKESLGDFSYSPEKFIQAATEFKHLFQRAKVDLLEEYFLKENALFGKYPELLELAKNQPERLWEFRRGIAKMIFVEQDGLFRILFSQSMTSLR